MKIAITGGTGFLGSHLINQLKINNFNINALSRDIYEDINNQLKWYQGDINDRKTLKLFLNDCEVVCNCAGEISNQENFKRNNVEGVKTLYEASVEAGVSLFIQISSAGIYKDSKEEKINEESCIHSSNKYEESKIDAEKWLFDKKQIRTVILRPTTIYGEKMPNKSLKKLFLAIFNHKFFFIGKSTSISCYISIDNVVDAILRVISKKDDLIKSFKYCDAYNLSHDIEYKEFINLAIKSFETNFKPIRLPLNLILALLWFNQKLFKIKLPLTSSRAKTLARTSTFSSEKFDKFFSWKPKYPHRKTINDCINNWFNINS